MSFVSTGEDWIDPRELRSAPSIGDWERVCSRNGFESPFRRAFFGQRSSSWTHLPRFGLALRDECSPFDHHHDPYHQRDDYFFHRSSSSWLSSSTAASSSPDLLSKVVDGSQKATQKKSILWQTPTQPSHFVLKSSEMLPSAAEAEAKSEGRRQHLSEGVLRSLCNGRAQIVKPYGVAPAMPTALDRRDMSPLTRSRQTRKNTPTTATQTDDVDAEAAAGGPVNNKTKKYSSYYSYDSGREWSMKARPELQRPVRKRPLERGKNGRIYIAKPVIHELRA